MRLLNNFSLFLFTTLSQVAHGQSIIMVPFSEFSIEFPSKPTRNIIKYIGIDNVAGEAISYQLITNDSVLKAEFAPSEGPQSFNAMTDQKIKDQMLSYMVQNGLHGSHVYLEHKGSLRIGHGRGTKFISHNGKKIASTYQSVVYYGNNSILILYVAAKSSDFPTDTISKFLNSVKIESEI